MSGPPPGDPLRAVIADPDDLAARLVWADALAAEGDPRGEFVLLQCHERPTELQQARMRALRRRWASRWAGGLWPLVSDGDARFARGTLVSCTLCWATEVTLQSLELEPVTALVEQVRLTRRFVPEERALGGVLAQLSGLRTLLDASLPETLSVMHAGLPLRTLELARAVDPLELERLHFPTLERLGVALADRVPLASATLTRHPGITELDVGTGRPATWRRAMADRLRFLRVRVPGWVFVLSRERLAHLEIYAAPDGRDDHATALIEALDGFDIRELDYVHVRSGRAPDRAALMALRRAVKGAPLLLPARWRMRL